MGYNLIHNWETKTIEDLTGWAQNPLQLPFVEMQKKVPPCSLHLQGKLLLALFLNTSLVSSDDNSLWVISCAFVGYTNAVPEAVFAWWLQDHPRAPHWLGFLLQRCLQGFRHDGIAAPSRMSTDLLEEPPSGRWSNQTSLFHTPLRSSL